MIFGFCTFFVPPSFTAVDNIEEQECGPDSWDPVQMQIFCNKYFFPRKQNSQILHSTLLTQQSAHFERIEPTISRDRQKISKNGSYPIFWTIMRYVVSHLGKKLSEKNLKFKIGGAMALKYLRPKSSTTSLSLS